VNGSRVNAIVDELDGEKIDVIEWDENEAVLIEHALSPAKVISVLADPDEKTALVIVPDYQLSLAIGKEGQNARLAAHLTQYKIDIKSESQAKEEGLFDEYAEDDEAEEYEDDEINAEDFDQETEDAAAEEAVAEEQIGETADEESFEEAAEETEEPASTEE
jgi:N utilization substance protein A